MQHASATTDGPAPGEVLPTSPRRIDPERAAKLARRASLSTTTILATSPLRDRFHDIDPPPPKIRSRKAAALLGAAPGDYPADGPTPRPESQMMSPLVFAKHTSIVLPPAADPQAFQLVVDGDDEEDSEDEDSISPVSGRGKIYARSELGHGHQSHSNPHLPLHPRAETPFANTAVALQAQPGYLAPPGMVAISTDGQEVVMRKERRQGWSGEWNRGDMQDVIQKLRNLK